MEIAQFLRSAIANTGYAGGAGGKAQNRTSATFNEYLSNFLNTANEVRQARAGTGSGLKDSGRVVSGNVLPGENIVLFKGAFSGEDVPEMLEPMTPDEQEAFERIALLIADGSLDSQELSELSEDEMDEIVAWVLSGASGLFEPYAPVGMPEENITENNDMDLFGLEKNIEILQQLQDVYSRIDDSDLSKSETAAIGQLLDIENLDLVEVDRLSQAIIELAEKYGDATEMDIEQPAAETGLTLREMLKNVPAEELTEVLQRTLESGEAEAELPELPETVLKSLCIEVVNVNNKTLDAAEINSRLLDGLNNNSELREQILRDVSDKQNGEELLTAVDAELLESADGEVADVLAEAVLEDSTEEELATLEQEIAEVGMDSEETANTAGEVVPSETENIPRDVEVVASVEVEAETERAKTTAGAEPVLKNLEDMPAEEGISEPVKVIVKSPVQAEVQVEEGQEALKDTSRDTLTGRAYSGNNEPQKEGMNNSSEQDRGNNEFSRQSGGGVGFEKEVFLSDEVAVEKVDILENFNESETRSDSKSFIADTPATSYTTGNAYVKYSDMIENMDRLSKLLLGNADKSMKSVTMELSPPELGKMTIDISVKDGNASAAIKVETDGAKHMLLNNIEQLKRNLEGHGIKLENFEVELNKQNQQDRQEQNSFAQLQQEMNERHSRKGRNRNTAVVPKLDGDVTEGVEQEVPKTVRDDGTVDVVA